MEPDKIKALGQILPKFLCQDLYKPSPDYGLVGALQGTISKLVYALRRHQQKKVRKYITCQ